MATVTNKIQLLIKEINPITKNDRTLRENLKRIENFLNGNKPGTLVQGGTTTVNTTVNASNSDISAANTYSDQVCTSNGQVSFTLPFPPQDDSKVSMAINGEDMSNGTHFTVLGTAVTFDPITSGFNLELVNEFSVPDRILFTYTKA